MNHFTYSCFICGTNKSVSIRQVTSRAMCDDCVKNTPQKVTRLYWQSKAETVMYSTRNEFWHDYLASTCTLDEYIKATIETLE